MKLLMPITVGFAVVLGCATTSPDRLPPEAENLPPEFSVRSPQDRKSLDYFLLKMADGQNRPNAKWWIDYQRARLWQEDDPSLACDKFSQLASDSQFPLRPLAAVRAFEACALSEQPQTSSTAPPPSQAIVEEHVTANPWLKAAWLDSQITAAEKRQDLSRWAELLIEKSKYSTHYEEKVSLAQKAINIAKEANNPALLKQATDRLYKVAPRFKPNPTKVDWFAVANDHRRAREFSQSIALYQRITQSKGFQPNQRISALKNLAQVKKVAGDREGHLEVLKKITLLTGKDIQRKRTPRQALTRHADAVSTAARALWTVGRVEEAEALLKSALKQLHGRTSVAEIQWILGRMAEERKDLPAAIVWMQQGAEDQDIDPSLKEKIFWSLAWNQRKLKNWPQALETFQMAREQSANEFSRARFQYWLARTAQDAGDQDVAVSELENLIEQDPLGYYGLMAHRALDRPIHRRLAPSRPPERPSRIAELMDPVVFRWLVALREEEPAQSFLDLTAESLRRQDREGLDEQTWTDLFRLYAQAGNYVQMYERLGRLPAEERNRILDQHPELLFPQPFKEIVGAAAAQVNLPGELLFSIMRQESAFNPLARSPADAFGLMQLLPEVALASAPRMQVNYSRAEDLYLPEVNIPLGAYHLRELWERFDQKFIPMVASYNASEKAIRNWLKVRFHGDAVEFIEDIPYEETRGYVRLVMRNFIFYQVMNNNGAPLPFPDWLLDL